jgi:Bacterial transglutaminase-like cysteine proteinase BTLCP
VSRAGLARSEPPAHFRLVHQLLARLVAPFARRISPRLAVADPWERYDYRVPLSAFGKGNRHEFGWYLEGESSVVVSSLDDVCEWLIGCSYAKDAELFHEQDFWQHPCTFEQLRRGDCEDHALWAWRKMVELGLDADLVVGTVLHGNEDVADRGSHAWVMFRQQGELLVFETVAKVRERMFQPLAAVRHRYRPEFGVDRRLQRYAFNGALVAFREERDRRSPLDPA